VQEETFARDGSIGFELHPQRAAGRLYWFWHGEAAILTNQRCVRRLAVSYLQTSVFLIFVFLKK